MTGTDDLRCSTKVDCGIHLGNALSGILPRLPRFRLELKPSSSRSSFGSCHGGRASQDVQSVAPSKGLSSKVLLARSQLSEMQGHPAPLWQHLFCGTTAPMRTVAEVAWIAGSEDPLHLRPLLGPGKWMSGTSNATWELAGINVATTS